MNLEMGGAGIRRLSFRGNAPYTEHGFGVIRITALSFSHKVAAGPVCVNRRGRR